MRAPHSVIPCSANSSKRREDSAEEMWARHGPVSFSALIKLAWAGRRRSALSLLRLRYVAASKIHRLAA